MSRFYSHSLVKMEFNVIVSRTVAPSLGSSVMNDVFIYIQGDFLEPSPLSKHSISIVSLDWTQDCDRMSDLYLFL